MTSTAHDRLVAVAPTSPRGLSVSQMSTQPDHRRPETSSTVLGGGSAVPPLATESRAPVDHHDKSHFQQQQQQNSQSQLMSVDDRFSQSDPRSAEGSQASNATTASDQVFTPTASEDATVPPSTDPTQDSQLLRLSALAAAQDRMDTDGDEYGLTRKRMADGVVKSPVKGHSRNTSAISMASTTSTIGDLSSELRTRLSYAMVKVNNGWQAHSLDEVESLASQAVSPTSSTSTAHRRNGSSISPQMRTMPQVHFANDPPTQRRNSKSPPNLNNRPTLAPPAPIRPAVSVGAPSTHPRRNSNPPYTPTLLSHSQTASPRTPGYPPILNTSQAKPAAGADSLYSPHQNVREVREQDAIESLLFMSSPNNSANMKHAFSPTGSPGPNGPTSQPTPRTAGRQPLPSGSRKALPNQRPAGEGKRAGYEMSPGAHPPNSPMDLDSPQQMSSGATRGMPRRRTDAGTHARSALSLPSALGISHVKDRKPITDKDIDSMLDRAGDGNSSDEEDIPLPPRRNGVAGAIRA